MQTMPILATGSPLIEIDPATQIVTWHTAGEAAPAGDGPRTVPWFPSVGVLDYARADRPAHPRHRQTAAATAPVFGDPLVVRTDLAKVFWRAGSVLHSAPIRCGRVDVTDTDAGPVDWAASDPHRRGQLRVIEHNLAQCSPLPTLDPPLHLVQVEESGRMSLSLLLHNSADGSPVIGPTPRHLQPYLPPGHLETARRSAACPPSQRCGKTP